ncbi:MAG: hypothetical protein ACXWEY_09880, partial [Bacteroidia bacterium]
MLHAICRDVALQRFRRYEAFFKTSIYATVGKYYNLDQLYINLKTTGTIIQKLCGTPFRVAGF